MKPADQPSLPLSPLTPSGLVPMVDAHLHLQEPDLLDSIDQVLARAQTAGVRYFVCNGTKPADWPTVANLARQYPGVIPCFGVHPWFARQDDGWETLLNQHLDSMPSAVGEIGLDRWIEPRDEAVQESVFRRQLAIARDRRLPVMVHCLRAWGWVMEVLADEAELPAGMLIHAYGGSKELIEPLLAKGAYFSFAGNAFQPKRVHDRDAMRAVPADRLLIETDSPDLLPPEQMRSYGIPRPGGTIANEPANLPAILQAVAAERAEDPEVLRNQIWQNARTLFGDLACC